MRVCRSVGNLTGKIFCEKAVASANVLVMRYSKFPHLALLPCIAAFVSFAVVPAVADDRAGTAFFEANIRPLLAERCYECHSAEKGQSKGGLTLDTRAGWATGGDSGAAVVPGKVEESLLIKAVRYTDADLAMPPKKKGGKLPAADIAKLEQWVAMGAPDPREGVVKKLTGMTSEAKAHWAFQPVKKPALPAVKHPQWPSTDVDHFILAKLEAAGLEPSAPADPDALLRRLFYDLWGLPPTTEQVAHFTQQWRAANGDAKAQDAALEHVVEYLLKSPHYGERWGRHWLDTARYSDTRGHVSNGGKYRYEDYRYAYAWTYRDYVIAALNDDKPYDQFIVEQLAADQLPDIRANDARLAGLGFLTVGKKFDNPNDVIDEQIDATTRGFLGLTVSCARCHDHKFDPIPIADYYSLHGIFASIEESYEKPALPARSGNAAAEDYRTKLADLEKRNRDHYYDVVQGLFDIFQKQLEARVVLHGWIAAHGHESPQAFEVKKRYNIQHEPEVDFQITLNAKDPVWGAYNALAKVAKDQPKQFAKLAPDVLKKALSEPRVNALVAKALASLQPQSLDEVGVAYARLIAPHLPEMQAVLKSRRAGQADAPDPAVVQLATSIWPIPPAAEIATTEQLMESYQRLRLTGKTTRGFLFSDINELRLTHPGAPGAAMVVQDVAKPHDSRVFIRGDEHKPGPVAPRQFLECLSSGKRQPFRQGSGRLELARNIASAQNPLTARTIVNRVWMHHFGEALVSTPDDLGNMSEKPSHPELLDFLAASFIESGWSLKKLHKLIVLSATYRQDANPNANRTAALALKTDAGNRLLWHANLRRLDFEGIRDSLLLLTGKLDPAIGGQPVNITDEPFSYRRSIYGYVDRLFLSDLPTQFDFADPMQTNSRRISTIVPQQALFFLNNPLVIEVSRSVVARPEVSRARNDAEKITALHRIIFQRSPSPDEVQQAQKFLSRASALPPPKPSKDPAAKKEPSRGSREEKTASLQNEGEPVPRAPLTPLELLVQTMICSNEFVYVN